MPIQINNVSRRAVYAPTGAGGAGPYSFTFEILAAGDIAVYKDDVLLTLTTHYTVSIAANGTGTVTITATGLALAPVSPAQYAIVGNRTIARTTDYVTGGDFFANTLNDELDQQTIFAQQNAEGIERSLKAPQTDPTSISMTMPRASARAGKVLSFDANGNPAAVDYIGENRGNWAAGVAYNQRDIAKDTTNDNIYQVLTPHTSAGSLPITTNADSAKWALLVNAAAANASAVAAAASASAASTSASNASTSASNASTSASNASTSASNASTSASAAAADAASAASALAQTLAAYDNFDDRYLGTKASDPSVDNDGNALVAGALYFDSTTGAMKVYTGSAWVAAYVSGGAGVLQAANNLSDVSSTTTARTNLGVGTGDSPQFTAVNIGNASDTTVTRVSAGVIAVEGSNVLLASNIGTTVQGYDAQLADIAGLTPTDNNFIVGNGTNFVAESGDTARTSLGVGSGDSPQFTAVNVGHASDTTVTRVSAGVIAVEGSNVLMASNIGSTVQAYDAQLADIAGLTPTDNGVVIGNGTNFVVESGATLKTSLGLTIGTDVQAYDADTAKTDVVQTFTAAQSFNSGNLKLNGSSSGTSTLNAAAVAGTTTITLPDITSTLGFRNIPPVGTKTGSYTLATSDVGEYVQVSTGGSITIPDATFAEGDAVSIFNNTTGAITITCTITTAYIAGTDTDKATVSLATRGVATILFISGTVCVITGNVS